MDPRTITIIIMAAVAAILIGWDIYVAVGNKVPNRRDTVSGITMGWSLKVWFLPYAVGVLGGHLFMPGVLLDRVTKQGIAILIATAVGLTIVGVVHGDQLSNKKWRVALRAYGLLNLGMIMGHLFWPQ